MKRSATNVIWRTVVVAGAMLATPACSKKQPQTTPANAAQPDLTAPTAPTTAGDAPDLSANPAADPAVDADCRARGCDDDGGGGVGRGFVLA
jgi:hypothetical protein